MKKRNDRQGNRCVFTVLRLTIIALGLLVYCVPLNALEKQTFPIPMTDGVKLATDVYLPSKQGSFPVILVRTPYSKINMMPLDQVRRGYAVVAQDMRGRFQSEGENLPFIGCGWETYQDGVDTLDWIYKQKWCNGKIGTMGASAMGITQNLLAGAQPKHLDCQYILVAAGSLYHHAGYVGGALRKSQIENWLVGNQFDEKAIALYRAHPTYDEFWYKFDSMTKHSVMTAPAVHFGGWFDTFSLGTVESFRGRQTQGAPGARGKQKLVMGPWAHGGFRNRGKVGELQFANSKPPESYSAKNWLDHYLKGIDNGVEKLPAVAYYVMGDTQAKNAPGNEWRYADQWPIPARKTPYYLNPQSALQKEKPRITMAQESFAVYTFDPQNPCPTVGGCNLVLPAGPKNQNKIEKRRDVIHFDANPLAEPVEVTGRIQAVLYVDSSAVDTDLSVRFCDVYPNGKSFLMAEGMLRLRYRDGFETAKLLQPGHIYEVKVNLWPTSVVVNKGHRLRIAITSSNYPRFDLNPGTGEAAHVAKKMVKQTNRIYCNNEYPSRIIFPIVEP